MVEQIFNSHRQWSWEYAVHCKDKTLKDHAFLRSQQGRKFMRRFNCLDRWHSGWHLTVPLARLLINHICAEAGVTNGKELHLNFK